MPFVPTLALQTLAHVPAASQNAYCRSALNPVGAFCTPAAPAVLGGGGSDRVRREALLQTKADNVARSRSVVVSAHQSSEGLSGAESRSRIAALLSRDPPATGAELKAEADAFLLASNTPSASATLGRDTMLHGQGTWKAFSVPHIQRVAALTGAKFDITYTLLPEDPSTRAGRPQFYSNVRYEHPLVGSGWLSASGSLAAAGDGGVQLTFDDFWVDVDGAEERLRPFLLDTDARSSWDGIVTVLGRVTFLPDLAVFPVLAFDPAAGLAVFRFSPLASDIAVIRSE